LAAKSAREAVDNFAGYFRETLSCITAGFVTVFQESKNLYKITCDPPARMSKRSGGHLFIIATQTLGISQNADNTYKVTTREYSYRLVAQEDIASEDIVAYHWHPHESDLRSPHLHLTEIPRIHFPTSRVCIEDFVMMLARYYDVRPRLPHTEWTGILEKNKAAFEKSATWKVKHPS
jgi:hypothetical protein